MLKNQQRIANVVTKAKEHQVSGIFLQELKIKSVEDLKTQAYYLKGWDMLVVLIGNDHPWLLNFGQDQVGILPLTENVAELESEDKKPVKIARAGLAILIKQATGWQFETEDPIFFSKEARTLSAVIKHTSGMKLRLVNLHLHTDPKWRAAQMATWVGELQGQEIDNLVVAGDMNSVINPDLDTNLPGNQVNWGQDTENARAWEQEAWSQLNMLDVFRQLNPADR